MLELNPMTLIFIIISTNEKENKKNMSEKK